jgi:NIMA (never in mitosis gene a)-related kinase
MPRGWVVSKELGRGAFGRALLVKKDGVTAVMKEISLEGMPASERKAAQSEVSVLKKLKNHPNIVSFMDSFMEGKKLHIVMEWAREGDLAAVIKKTKASRLKLEEDRVLTIFFQCCAALHFMHEHNILHRDIKPANIFLTRSGEQMDIVKLGDFGIAKVLAHTMARARTVAGTPYYMAPELCQERPYTTTADCWSLGCVLHELCALDVPFAATSMAALVRKIINGRPKRLPSQYSAELRSVVDSMLKKQSQQRPSMKRLLGLSILQKHGRELANKALNQASSDDNAASNNNDPTSQKPRRPTPSRNSPAPKVVYPPQRKQQHLPLNHLQDRLARLKQDLAKLGGGGTPHRMPLVNPALHADEAQKARRERAGLGRLAYIQQQQQQKEQEKQRREKARHNMIRDRQRFKEDLKERNKKQRERELLKARLEQQRRKEESARKREIEKNRQIRKHNQLKEKQRELEKRKKLEEAWVNIDDVAKQKQAQPVVAAANLWYKGTPLENGRQQHQQHQQQQLPQQSPQMDPNVRRKIWEENQKAMQRNRNRAKCDDSPKLNHYSPTTEKSPTRVNNQRERVDGIKLDADMRRQIWEENQRALKKNAANAAADQPPPAPSTPKHGGGNEREFGEDEKIEKGKRDENARVAFCGATPPPSEDEHLVRLEKARKEAYQERLKLHEKYKNRGTMQVRKEEKEKEKEDGDGDGDNDFDEREAVVKEERQDKEGDISEASQEFASLAETIVSILMDQTIEISYSSDEDKKEVVDDDLILPPSRADDLLAEWKEEQKHQQLEKRNKKKEANQEDVPSKRRPARRRPRMELNKVDTVDTVPSITAPKLQSQFQPPTPLADCNSALAQLTKELNAQERQANLKKGELIRQTLENVLGELGFLRLYRSARIEKRRQTSKTSKILLLMDTVPEIVGKTRKNLDSRMVVEQMLSLLDLEDM